MPSLGLLKIKSVLDNFYILSLCSSSSQNLDNEPVFTSMSGFLDICNDTRHHNDTNQVQKNQVCFFSKLWLSTKYFLVYS